MFYVLFTTKLVQKKKMSDSKLSFFHYLYYQIKSSLCTEPENDDIKKSRIEIDTDTQVPPLVFINSIATQLRPIVRILRYTGGYPIDEVSIKNNKSQTLKKVSISKVDDSYNKRPIYKFLRAKWTNVASWYSYLLRAVAWAAMVTFIFNIGLDMPYPYKITSHPLLHSNLTSDFGRTMNCIAMNAIGSLRLLDFTLLYFSCGSFVNWLNDWSGFEREFFNCFTNSQFYSLLSLNVRKVQTRMIFFFIILPGIFLFVTFTIAISNLFEFHVVFFGHACVMISIVVFTFCPIVEDCKVLIMFKTSILAFEQMKLGIIERSKPENFPVTFSDVIGWRDLIVRIQEQTALACSHLKNQNLIFVAETIFSCSMGIACFVVFLRDSNQPQGVPFGVASGALLSCGYMAFNTFGRLYLKVSVAVNISAQELLLAANILKVESKCNDPAAKAELKYLHSMLTLNPIKVNIGGYFALNKELLLQVCSQAVTYLIVIMQFQQGSSQFKT